MYPDFLVIGAQKAGTTWLHRNLQAHPEIWMPQNEVHYFDRKIKESGTFDERWYASLFEEGQGKTVGDCTPAYSIVGKEMVAYVHELMPDAKIIFLMRSPIERAWSQAVMRVVKKEGSVENLTEEQLLSRVSREKSQLRTNYLRTLENWGTYYSEDRIFIGFLEDISFMPESLLTGVHEFLGIDPSFRPPALNKRINSRSSDTMPTSVATHLAHTYHGSMRRLSELFGGYASFWLYSAEWLIEAPPEGQAITYPLWDSSLRENWSGGLEDPSAVFSREAKLQSGPLSAIQVPR